MTGWIWNRPRWITGINSKYVQMLIINIQQCANNWITAIASKTQPFVSTLYWSPLRECTWTYMDVKAYIEHEAKKPNDLKIIGEKLQPILSTSNTFYKKHLCNEQQVR